MFESLRKTIANIISPVKNAVSLGNQFLRYGSKAMTPGWSQVVMSDEDHYTGYFYAAIRKRANTLARLASVNVETTSSKEKDDFVHPYLTLIENSLLFSEYQFWSDISTYLDLEGVYYLFVLRNVEGERIGDVQQFSLLNPYHIRRVMDPNDKGKVAGYVESRNGLIREIPKEMIIEIKELNPFDWNKNFAMTDAAKDSQFTLKTADDFTRHTLKNNISAPGILSTDVILEDKDFQNFANRVKNHTKGEPLFGNGQGAITWESMTNDLPEKALGQVNEINRDSLFSVAGVSKTFMGIEQSGTTRDTASVQKDLMVETESLPRIQKIIDSLNLDYKNKYPKEFKKDEASLIVINPLATDIEANIKGIEEKQSESDLYNGLLEKGYDADKSAQYVEGVIPISELGEPDRPETAATEESRGKKSCDHSKHDHVIKTDNLTEKDKGLVAAQEGALKNAVTNIDQQIVAESIARISKTLNAIEDETDVIGIRAKNRISNELELVLTGFYGIITTLQGGKVMRKRVSEFALPGVFTLDRVTKRNIKRVADKVATSHVNTVVEDIFGVAREEALKGSSLEEVSTLIKNKYNDVIATTRANTIARTETNRAFTMAQFEADRQFIKQNKLGSRAFKKWQTRSDDPCPFCLELESRPPIPFNKNFKDLGSTLTVDGNVLPVNFEALEAGNAHPNCGCVYELIIISKEANFLKTMKLESNQITEVMKELEEIL